MISKAVARYIRVSPRKARLVADLVRGKTVDEAMALLKFTTKKAAQEIYKTLKSAVANAEENKNVRNVSNLKLLEVKVDGGPFYKRYMPRAYGRASLIKRRTSHITVVLGE
ncbi:MULTISPECIES: 50S ribosomal protein L22 [Calditerrivibrio]|jgi:large subunit ribosomal protein L22|uniref:Large ribosomal subunit protein uL22 n=2 Tax=Calditerrivibrio nitroreducens TaxID=477976 RepID=E4TEQ3_CALNY|nr:50S ribosomal protein L22 [Calditerrivibrio nitroreducens]ADR19410.1 LSU ribosomal protein L22P [Calditerrivibrio nitroreducens DSM 19672]PMP72576.1 MAG: 50S ribosomal protein L22 [Calditerrivibrio nitroreducens]